MEEFQYRMGQDRKEIGKLLWVIKVHDGLFLYEKC